MLDKLVNFIFFYRQIFWNSPLISDDDGLLQTTFFQLIFSSSQVTYEKYWYCVACRLKLHERRDRDISYL